MSGEQAAVSHAHGAKTWCFKALTDIWSGDAERKGDRTIPTGLLGSLRWWCEVLVRGLGGSACDPSQHECPDCTKQEDLCLNQFKTGNEILSYLLVKYGELKDSARSVRGRLRTSVV